MIVTGAVACALVTSIAFSGSTPGPATLQPRPSTPTAVAPAVQTATLSPQGVPLVDAPAPSQAAAPAAEPTVHPSPSRRAAASKAAPVKSTVF